MIEGIHALTKLCHENILPLFGITTKFHGKISLVSEWMEKGSAHEFVQSGDIDPHPLVCGNTYPLPLTSLFKYHI